MPLLVSSSTTTATAGVWRGTRVSGPDRTAYGASSLNLFPSGGRSSWAGVFSLLTAGQAMAGVCSVVRRLYLSVYNRVVFFGWAQVLYYAVLTLRESGHKAVYAAVERPLQLAQTAAIMEAGTKAENVYHVGQVVKCRIINVIPASRKLNVSFVISHNRVIPIDTPKLGSIVSGVVERLTPAAVVVSVNGFSKGTILNEHLADHHGQAAKVKNLLKPGHEFNQLLVLDIEGQNLVLSAKHSLINCANGIPSEISQMHPGVVVHGYICNIIEAGCFVRFLGHLTGFSPKDKAVDRRIERLSDAFYVGQSVRSHILSVNAETARVKLALQQSMCSSTDSSFIQGYFLLDQKDYYFYNDDSRVQQLFENPQL